MLQAKFDIDMPEKCMWDCPFCNSDGGECELSISDIATSPKGRPKDCPLEEVKETTEPCEDAISRLDVFYMLAQNASEISDDAFWQMCKELDEEPTVQPAQPAWIPVSKRLPEAADYVLATDGEDMFIAWRAMIATSTRIIAWMPLPEPYEPQESEE